MNFRRVCRIKIYSYICNPFVYGAISSVGRALDCGSRCRGFEPHIAPLGRAGNLTALFVKTTEKMKKELLIGFFFFMALCPLASGQKMSKGTWMLGGSASYSSQNNDNADFIVVSGLDAKEYDISFSPAFCYMIKDNMGIGARVGYKRNMMEVDRASLDLGDIAEVQFSDYYKISQSFDVQGIARYYIPLSFSSRIGLFSEFSLGWGYGQGKVLDGSGNAVNGTYEVSNSIGLNMRPGMLVFITDRLCVDVCVNMLSFQYDWTHQIHNQIESGDRHSSAAYFMFDALSLSFGLYYYI